MDEMNLDYKQMFENLQKLTAKKAEQEQHYFDLLCKFKQVKHYGDIISKNLNGGDLILWALNLL